MFLFVFLAELSPTTAKSLQDLLDYPDKDVEDVFSLTFSINESFFGEVVTKPLKTGKHWWNFKINDIPNFSTSRFLLSS